MSVKSNFFKLNKTDFDKYLNDLKTSNNSIHLLEDKFFFNQTVEISNMVISLNKKNPGIRFYYQFFYRIFKKTNNSIIYN